MNNADQLKIMFEIEQTKGKISILTKHIQLYTFELKRLQTKKDELENKLLVK